VGRTHEIENGDTEFGLWFKLFSHYFCGSIIMAVSPIEALYTERLKPSSVDTRMSLIKRLKLLKNDSGAKIANFSRPPGQNLSAVISLRDRLVHPYPATPGSLNRHDADISEIEKAGKFITRSKYFDKENTIYRYFTHLNSKWAVENCKVFSIEMLDAMGHQKLASQFRAV
jgi:hypothetical protein